MQYLRTNNRPLDLEFVLLCYVSRNLLDSFNLGLQMEDQTMIAFVQCRNKGILFVAIDHTRPLSDQGPFDIVLHKVSRYVYLLLHLMFLCSKIFTFLDGFFFSSNKVLVVSIFCDAVIRKGMAAHSRGWSFDKLISSFHNCL